MVQTSPDVRMRSDAATRMIIRPRHVLCYGEYFWCSVCPVSKCTSDNYTLARSSHVKTRASHQDIFLPKDR